MSAFLLAACSLHQSAKTSILGKWLEENPEPGKQPETDEYLADGTIIVNVPPAPGANDTTAAGIFALAGSPPVHMTGKYSFPDDTHIKIMFDGLYSIAGAQVLTIGFSNGKLVLTEPEGHVGSYRRADSR